MNTTCSCLLLIPVYVLYLNFKDINYWNLNTLRIRAFHYTFKNRIMQGSAKTLYPFHSSPTTDKSLFKGQPITHESLTNNAQIWVCACLCIEKLTKFSGCRGKKPLTNHALIMHEPRTYNFQSLTNN